MLELSASASASVLAGRPAAGHRSSAQRRATWRTHAGPPPPAYSSSAWPQTDGRRERLAAARRPGNSWPYVPLLHAATCGDRRRIGGDVA